VSAGAEVRARDFRRLHGPGHLLVLPNAWDAGSARLIETCGAEAIATTSAGMAWSHGHADGGALPPRVLADAVAEISRVVSVPVSVDVEGGYATDPGAVGENVAAVLDAGAVGVNLEDGVEPPALLSAKIEAARQAAARAGVDLFVNARTDVCLRRLVAPEHVAREVIERGRRYRDAGADGLFVPGLIDGDGIREIAAAVDLPVNVLLVPGLPAAGELRSLGVRRLSVGAWIARSAYGLTRLLAARLLAEGGAEATPEPEASAAELNALFRPPAA
jgi:2-methylisocitrate lyase-like PEP mutase family enzyme